MFSIKDIANLKEVIHNQGGWHKHTSISMELQDHEIIQDEAVLEKYAKLLSNTISTQKPGKYYVAKEEKEKSYSIFQFVEGSCIAGDFSNKKFGTNIEIFSSNAINLDEILQITRDFFNCNGLEVTTYSKIN